MDSTSALPQVNGLTTADFQRLEDKLDRIEAMLSGSHQLLNDVPHLAATATNVADELVTRLAERDVDVDARAHQLLHILEHMTHPTILKSLDHLLARPEQLTQLLGVLEQAPGTLAMVVNITDDLIARMYREGVDIEQVFTHTAASLKILVEFLRSEEFEALMASSVFAPETLETIAKMAQALQSIQRDGVGEVGLFGALRRARQPSVRRALDFGLRFAGRFGELLARPTRSLTSH